MKYKIWDGVEDVYTPDGKKFSADEWREMFGWVNAPGAQMIIADAPINGAVAMEYEQTKTVYKNAGAKITDDMTVEEVLSAISVYEENPPVTVASAEERIAAALEAQVMMAEEDIEQLTASTFAMRTVGAMAMDEPGTGLEVDAIPTAITVEPEEESAAFVRTKNNYDRGLWSASLVKMAVKKGHITQAEYQKITGKSYA